MNKIVLFIMLYLLFKDSYLGLINQKKIPFLAPVYTANKVVLVVGMGYC
jgi:hypothetical protein